MAESRTRAVPKMPDRPPPSRTPRARRSVPLTAGWIVVFAAYPVASLVWLWPADGPVRLGFFALVSFAVFMMQTFAFHAGLALGAVMLIAAWTRAKRLALVGAVPVVLLLGPELAAFLPKRARPVVGPTLRVMEFNLLHSNDRIDAAADEIRRAEADLLVLLEYDPDWHRHLGAGLAKSHLHYAIRPKTGSFGWAVFSKHPFIDPPQDLVTDIPNRNLVRSVLSVDGQPLVLFAVHLNPPKGVANFVSQTAGLHQLTGLLDQEELPVVVCGDFNFTCRHGMHRALIGRGLADAHQQAGWGRGSTWPADRWRAWLPGVRIDHLYLTNELGCTAIRTGKACGSDHRPVIADVGFVNANEPRTSVRADQHPR